MRRDLSLASTPRGRSPAHTSDGEHLQEDPRSHGKSSVCTIGVSPPQRRDEDGEDMELHDERIEAPHPRPSPARAECPSFDEAMLTLREALLIRQALPLASNVRS